MRIIKKTCTRKVPLISLCTLGSINLGLFRNPEDTRRACRLLVRSLNNILDYQDYLSIQSELSNQYIKPLGIGITNLAYFFAKRNLKYGEPDALAEIKIWMEHINYYLVEASIELAKERGPCEHSHLTRYGQGIFPWELRAEGVNELVDFTPELDWETLRENLKKYGIRNATLSAVAPVESCVSFSTKLNFVNGDRKDFHELLEDQNIDWKEIESTCDAGTVVQLNEPIEISGVNGPEVVTEVIYNGLQKTTEVEFEDGSIVYFTDNHRLLVNRNGTQEWVYIFNLQEDDVIVNKPYETTLVKRIKRHCLETHTWDISTPSHTYLLPNGCVSHNSSVVVNSTNGIELPMSLISTKESKSGSLTQVVPDYHKLKNKYQLMWDQTDCIDYLKTAAVINVYIDQSISTNTFFNGKNYPDRKIPATLIARNLMLCHKWGLKTHYYNLTNKLSAKVDDEDLPSSSTDEDDEPCLGCTL